MKLNMYKKITLLVGCLILGISLGLGVAAITTSSKMLREQTNESLVSLAHEGAKHVNVLLESNFKDIKEIAERDLTKSMDWKQLSESLMNDLQRLGLTDLSIVTNDRLSRSIKTGQTVNVDHLEYIERAFQGENTISSIMVNEETGYTSLSYATPILRDNQVVAVLHSEMDSSFINQIVSELGYGKNGFAYVIDSMGCFIAHEDIEEVKRQHSIFDDKLDDNKYIELGRKIKQSGFTHEGRIHYKYEDTVGYLGVSPIESTDWIIAVGAYEDDVMGRVSDLSYFLSIMSTSYILLGIIGTFIVGKRISKPIVAVSGLIKQLANFDLRKENEGVVEKYIKRRDEFGDMSVALISMNQNLRNLVVQITDTSQIVASSSKELTVHSEETVHSAKEVARAVEEIARGASNQSEDTEHGVMEAEVLGNMIQKNQENLDILQEKSNEVSTLRQEGLDIVHTLVEQTKASDEASIVIFDAIDNVCQSAYHIESASQMIQVISKQTNLLALNASIEAARAGESGKGFAVVADEIRKLADQSNNFTKSITNEIEDLKNKANQALLTMKEIGIIVSEQSHSVTETSSKYEGIAAAIEKMNHLIGVIYQSGQEMQEGKEHIIDIMQNLSAISEENAAGTEEASASVEQQTSSMEDIAKASEELTNLATELQNLVVKFQV